MDADHQLATMADRALDMREIAAGAGVEIVRCHDALEQIWYIAVCCAAGSEVEALDEIAQIAIGRLQQ